MDLTPVDSSNIESVGHDPATSELRVKFKSGHTYSYLGVSAAQHAEFMQAPSKGQHFHRNVRGKHEGLKLQQ
jgi:hypothetical protein